MTAARRQARGARGRLGAPPLEQGQRRDRERGHGEARRNEGQRRQRADVLLNDERDAPNGGSREQQPVGAEAAETAGSGRCARQESDLLDLDQRADEVLGMQEQHRLAVRADLRLAVAEHPRARGLQRSRAAMMSSTSKHM